MGLGEGGGGGVVPSSARPPSFSSLLRLRAALQYLNTNSFFQFPISHVLSSIHATGLCGAEAQR